MVFRLPPTDGIWQRGRGQEGPADQGGAQAGAALGQGAPRRIFSVVGESSSTNLLFFFGGGGGRARSENADEVRRRIIGHP